MLRFPIEAIGFPTFGLLLYWKLEVQNTTRDALDRVPFEPESSNAYHLGTAPPP